MNFLLPSPQPKTGGIWETKDRIVQVCGRMSYKSEIQPSVLTEGPNGELLTKYYYFVKIIQNTTIPLAAFTTQTYKVFCQIQFYF